MDRLIGLMGIVVQGVSRERDGRVGAKDSPGGDVRYLYGELSIGMDR